MLLSYFFRKAFYRRLVKQYLALKPNRAAKVVVYSCITGDYDKPIKLHNIKYDYDYIMFVDKPERYDQKSHVWEFRRLEINGLDGARASRYPKLNPHKLLPEYRESIWIDANIDIVSDTLYGDVERTRKSGAVIAIGAHPKRNCVYEEFQRCLAGDIDSRKIIRRQLSTIEADGYPKENGLFENNVIYRRHHDAAVMQFDADCWNMIVNGSKRDQLALVYCAWKNGLTIAQLNPVAYRRLKRDVIIYPHQ